jgi:hypothetical protein
MNASCHRMNEFSANGGQPPEGLIQWVRDQVSSGTHALHSNRSYPPYHVHDTYRLSNLFTLMSPQPIASSGVKPCQAHFILQVVLSLVLPRQSMCAHKWH